MTEPNQGLLDLSPELRYIACSKRVWEVANQAHSFIIENMKSNLSPTDHWLLVGRVIASLFSRHFQHSYRAADETMTKKEAARPKVKRKVALARKKK